MSRRIVLALLALAAAPVVAENAEAPMQMHTSPVDHPAPNQSGSEAAESASGSPIRTSAAGRAGRRLPRRQGRRPLPLAGGRRRAGDPRLGRGPEQAHLRPTCGAIPERERDPRAADRAVELRALRRPRPRRAAATSSPGTTACRTRTCSTGRTRSTASRGSLLDPNTLSADGTVALAGVSVSEDGKLPGLRPRRRRLGLAGVAGARRRDRPGPAGPTCSWVKFSGAAWTQDGKGFFYSRYDEPKDGRRAGGGQLLPEALLPPARHAAGGGRARLRAARPEGVGLRRRRSPTTAATSSSTSGRGPRPRTASSTRISRSPRRAGGRAARRLRRRLQLRRQRRPGLLVPDRPGRAARAA